MNVSGIKQLHTLSDVAYCQAWLRTKPPHKLSLSLYLCL
jgi:hypothetical protein